MNYHNIKEYDIANGPGIRTSIWVTGCRANCVGCFNTDIKDFASGNPFDKQALDKLIKCLQNKNVRGLSILGGEPLDNVFGVLDMVGNIISNVDEFNLRHPYKKDIWLWTGKVMPSVMKGYFNPDTINEDEAKLNLIAMCDYVVDGPFLQERMNHNIRFRGSDNQRILKVIKKTDNTFGIKLIFEDVSALYDAGKSTPPKK